MIGTGGLKSVRQYLHSIVNNIHQLLNNRENTIDAVVLSYQYLENKPSFNTETGAILQFDGQVHMTISLDEIK